MVHSVNSFPRKKWYSVVLDTTRLLRERKDDMGNYMHDVLWAEAVEGWANEKVKEYLVRNHEGYQRLWIKSGMLCEKCPAIDTLIYGKGGLKLTSEEHRIFIEYLDIKDLLEQLEREYHYYLGLSMTLPFGQLHHPFADKTGRPQKEKNERKKTIIDILAEGRMEGAERKFQESNGNNREDEKTILELEASIERLGLPEEARHIIDLYVSAVNAQWLKYSEFMYRYGIEDMLALFM